MTIVLSQRRALRRSEITALNPAPVPLRQSRREFKRDAPSIGTALFTRSREYVIPPVRLVFRHLGIPCMAYRTRDPPSSNFGTRCTELEQ